MLYEGITAGQAGSQNCSCVYLTWMEMAMRDPDEYSIGGSKLDRHDWPSTSTTLSLALVSTPQATFEVTTLDDLVDAGDGVLSLREAVQAANASPSLDTISFADDLRGQTLTLTQGQLVVTDDLVIDGDPLNGGFGGITITTDVATGFHGASRAFLADGSSLGLADLTVTGAGSDYYAAEDVIGIAPYGDQVTGGAIGVVDGSLTLDRVALVDNAPSMAMGGDPWYRGGAIIGLRSDILLTESYLARNVAPTETFRYAGGVTLVDGTLVANGTTFAYNGGTAVVGRGSFTFQDSTVLDNSGGLYGVAALWLSGRTTIVDSLIADNFGYKAIQLRGDAWIERSTIQGNSADSAPVILGGGQLSIVNSTFADNVGFGFYTPFATGALTIYSGLADILNSTFTGNSASAPEHPDWPFPDPIQTGAIDVRPEAELTLTNSLVIGNSFRSFPGSGPFSLEAASSSTDDADFIVASDIFGSFTSGGGNIFGQAVVPDAIGSDRVGIDSRDVFAETRPILLRLGYGTSDAIDLTTGLYAGVTADNGGPNPTAALLDDPANPALDQADASAAPATDQRGFPRDATPDIGSFELDGVPPGDEGLVVTTLDDTIVADGQVSLREAVAFANSQAGADTITFADAIRGGTIELVPRTPLIITDDLVIDGDPLDRGADSITISGGGDPFWGGMGSPSGVSPVELRGDSAEIDVKLEDLTIADFNTVDSAIHGENAAVDLTRVAVSEIFDDVVAAGIVTDGLVSLQDSTIGYIAGGFAAAYGVVSSTGISAVDSRVENLIGVYVGGGMDAPTVSMVRSTVDGVFGEWYSLGVTGDELSILDSTISNIVGGGENYFSPGTGFGSAAKGNVVDIINSTIAENVLASSEGPAGVVDGDSVSIRNSTIATNPVGDQTYGVRGTDVDIANSILQGNGANGENDVAPGTVVTSNGHNVFGQSAVAGAEPGDVLGASSGALFLTGALADNGGPTETIALLDDPTNPALNTADPADAPETDQRGFLRDATPDIGAFEVNGVPALLVTTLADTVNASDGLLSLREAIDLANSAPGADAITFAEAIRGGTIELTRDLPMIRDDLLIDGDPGDGGPDGIVLDGGLKFDTVNPSPDPVSGTETLFRTVGADLSLEDLTTTGVALSIEAEAADVGLDQVVIGGSIFPPIPNGPAQRGVDIVDGSLAMVDSAIIDDSIEFGGQTVVGIDFSNSDISLLRSTITVGSLGAVGSAKALRGNGTATIVDSTLVDTGGELLNINGETVVRNSTLYFSGQGFMELAGNSLFDFSTIRDAGGNPYLPTLSVPGGSLVELRNTIFDGDISGTIVSDGTNVFTASAVDGAEPGDVLGATTGELFLTGELADNGGPTETIALLRSASNPTLDAADPADAPATDQRGFLRDATPDIGAFELELQPPSDTLPPLAEKVPLPDSEIVGAPLFLVGAAGDAEIAFVDEVAAFQSSLGVYLVGPDGTIGATEWVFDRIEHSEASDLASEDARPGGGPLAPGDAVLLSDLFAPEELTPGTGFGLFLVADGWALNDPSTFDKGRLAFRSDGDAATVKDVTPELVFIADNGHERLVLGDILHTIDAGSPNPLSNKLNPGDTGQVTSGLLDGAFTVAFEDKPLSQNSDRDFNDALFSVDAANTAPPDIAEASEPAAVTVEALLTEAEAAA